MNLFKIYLFQNLFFKQAKFLLSTPDRAQTCIYISDSGTITKEVLPMETAFMSAANLHKTWKVEHALKIIMKDSKGIVQDDPILCISDRDYIPLDPFMRLGDDDRKKLATLEDIAKIKHAEKRANVGSGEDDPRTRLFNTITTWSWIAIIITVVAGAIRG